MKTTLPNRSKYWHRKATLAAINKKERIMRTLLFLLIILLALVLSGCGMDRQLPQSNHIDITGSGHIVSREVGLVDFDRVEAGLNFSVTIRQGDGYGVLIMADDNFIDFIGVEKVGTTLTFDLKPGYAYNYRGVTTKAIVTMPHLHGLHLENSGWVEIDDFDEPEIFTAELSGSTALTGELDVDRAEFSMSGSSYVGLSGAADELWADVCGSSQLDLQSFRAQEAAVEVACNGLVLVNVNGRLDIDAAQNAQVFYTGQPVLGEVGKYEYASIVALEKG